MTGAHGRLLARCRTENQVNRVHILLGERMTPREVEAMGRAPDLPPAARAFAEEQAGWMARSGKEAPEPFRRRRVGRDAFLFSGPPDAGKTLLVGFTGVARRLFLPMPVLLQHLSAERQDLLVLRDPAGNGYRGGVPGVPGGFPGLLEDLGRRIDRSRYGAVVSWGTSGGGLPAVLAALHLGLDKGVSVGGRSPLHRKWGRAFPGGAIELARRALSRPEAPPPLLLVHGADWERDAESARESAGVLPATVLAVRCGEGRRVPHNALFPLLGEGRLGAFLEEAFDPSLHRRGTGAGAERGFTPDGSD